MITMQGFSARKLIHIDDHSAELHCDNAECGWDVPKGWLTWGPHLIGTRCPRCGSDMLTRQDYDAREAMLRAVAWVNRWFWWLGTSKPTTEVLILGHRKDIKK